MMMQLNFLMNSMAVYSYLALGLAAMIEGPLALLTGGAAIASGTFSPLPAYLTVVSGSILADLGWYGLGRLGRMDWISWLLKKTGMNPERLRQVQDGIGKHPSRLLFLSKMTVGLPIPTLIATGLSRVPVLRWLPGWLTGELLKSGIIITIGYLFARSLQYASQSLRLGLWVVTGVLVLAAYGWFRWQRRKRAA